MWESTTFQFPNQFISDPHDAAHVSSGRKSGPLFAVTCCNQQPFVGRIMLGRSLHFGCTPPVRLFVIADEEGVACKNIKHESLGDNNISHRGALTVIYGDRDALD